VHLGFRCRVLETCSPAVAAKEFCLYAPPGSNIIVCEMKKFLSLEETRRFSFPAETKGSYPYPRD
jgi:hypothetical protein